MAELNKFIICSSCGHKNASTFNFCEKCARKIRMVCNCWVLKKEYNCGHSECPGFDLLNDVIRSKNGAAL